MPILKYNNGDISYSVVGQGEPIVFIHGFGLDSRMWQPQIEKLSKTHQIITYDLRGFGKSSMPIGQYSHVDDLNALLELLGVSKTDVVGHSFGGEIALNFVLKYPKKVQKLFLIASSLSGYDFENKLWGELMELGKNENVNEIRNRLLNHEIFDSLEDKAEVKNRVRSILKDYSCWHFLNKDLRQIEIKDSMSLLEQIDVPVSIIIGEEDVKAQKEIAEILDKNLPKSTLNIIKNAGHMINLEEPEKVSEIINRKV
jgi:3-oxoadipate enol-lactonase